jgi:hypothetical protein
MQTFLKDPELFYGATALPKNNNNPLCDGQNRSKMSFQNTSTDFKFPEFRFPDKPHPENEHPDMMVRIFKQYLEKIIDYFKKSKILGTIKASVVRIEFQKRGMPHAHLLLWTDCDLNDPISIEKYVSAEFPTQKHAELDFHTIFSCDFDAKNNLHVAFMDWYLPQIQARVKSFMSHKHSKRCGVQIKPALITTLSFNQILNAGSMQ